MSNYQQNHRLKEFPRSNFSNLAIEYFENGYQTVMPSEGKAIFIKGWQYRGEQPPSLDELYQAVDYYKNRNLSLVYGPACPVIAIDIDSKEHSYELEALTFEALGTTPLISFGNWPKRKLIYAKAPNQNFETKRFQPLVEVFAGKGQTVLEGLHPVTGKAYGWVGESPATTPVSELPVVTKEMMLLWEKSFSAWMTERGISNSLPGSGPGAYGKHASSVTGPQADLLATLKMERKSCHSEQDFIACVTRHLVAMRPGNRHIVMTATVGSLVGRGIAEDRIWSILNKHYVNRYGDQFSLRSNKVTKALTSAKGRSRKWQAQHH